MHDPLITDVLDEEKGLSEGFLTPKQRVKRDIAYEADSRTSLGEFYRLTDEQLKETIEELQQQMRQMMKNMEATRQRPSR